MSTLVVDSTQGSPYVERFWLSVLGPSTTWLVRHLADQLKRASGPLEIDFAETARTLGLGGRYDRNASFMRTLQRAIDFNMITARGPHRLGVRRTVPLLSGRLVMRLPPSLRQAHQDFLVTNTPTRYVGELEEHGRQLALSLLEIGESPYEAERQLTQLHFPPTLAHSCVHFATIEYERRGSRHPRLKGAPV